MNNNSINKISKKSVIKNANHLLNNTLHIPKKITRNETICDILSDHSVNLYNKLAFKFINHSKETYTEHTFLSLHLKAKSVAYHIQKLTKIKQERALLLVPQSMEFIDAFLGCLYANTIAVPAYPPKLNRSITRLNTILSDCQPSIIITTNHLKEKINRLQEKYNLDFSGKWLCIDDIKTSDNIHFDDNLYKVKKDDVAFLQYTSGSTGQPKGVMVTHKNIMENEAMIKDFFNHNEENTTVVGWLPFFHDMGLIGNILQPLFLGSQCILTPYIDVLQTPYLWLKMISDYKANTSGSPNFMYDLCCEKITEEQKQSLNLKHWKVAYNGAEPINSSTLKRFSEKFKDCGFEESNFFPCYGMAEATLIITGHKQGTLPKYKYIDNQVLKTNNVIESKQPSKTSKEFVSSGYNHKKQLIKIVNHTTLLECKKNEVGEIWVNGPHITKGYWNKESVNKAIFNAKLANSKCEKVYLRTGDLGFLDENNALFITGRIKDTMIINGKNIYPQDIESTIELSHEGLRKSFCACFSISESTEKIVAVVELKRQFLRNSDHFNIIESIKENLSKYDQSVNEIILIKTNTISKTSSGKLQRYLIKENYLNNTLNIIYSSTDYSKNKRDVLKHFRAPKNKIEEDIITIFKTYLNSSEIYPEDSLLSLGIDSLGLAELTFKIEKQFFVSFPIDELLSIESIEQLCAKIEEKQLDKLNNLDINMLQEFLIDFDLKEKNPSHAKKENTIA